MGCRVIKEYGDRLTPYSFDMDHEEFFPCFSICMYIGVIWNNMDPKNIPHLEWARPYTIAQLYMRLEGFLFIVKCLFNKI